MSTKELNNLIQPSVYDTSQTLLYKKAIELGYPVSFILIQPSKNFPDNLEIFFDLDDNPDAEFTSIVNVIRKLVVEKELTLDEINEIIPKSILGDRFNNLDLIYIWLFAVPEYQIENTSVLDQINTYRKNIGEIVLKSMAEILDEYTNYWYPNLAQEYNKDLEKLKILVKSQTEISQIQPLEYSPFNINFVTVEYEYLTEPGINPLLDLFNSATNSQDIPFIQYNAFSKWDQYQDNQRYFKILRSKNYNYITIPQNYANQPQTLYLNIYDPESSEKLPKYHISKISYDELNNKIQILVNSPRTEFINEWNIINLIHKHILLLPTKPDLVKKSKIMGDFTVYDVELFREPLSYLIMSDPLFNSYLSINERSKVSFLRPDLIVNYKGVSINNNPKEKTKIQQVIKSVLDSKLVFKSQEISIFNPTGNPIIRKNQNKMPAITINIKNSSSEKTINRYVEILARLLNKYKNLIIPVMDRYLQFIPEYNNILIQNQEIKKQVSGPEIPATVQNGRILLPRKKITILKTHASDIFIGPGYAKDCGPKRQPILIRPDEVPFWENQQFFRENIPESRKILGFPKDDPRYLFVCPENNYPYPSLIPNKSKDNIKMYPEIPCCFNDKKDAADRLDRYYKNMVKITTKSDYVRKGNNILNPGRLAYINSAINNKLKEYSDESGEFYRYGVYKSNNSFIHCVLKALNYSEYLTSKDKEDYVKNFRINLISQIYPELLRQELYDLTNDEIINILNNQEEFFDPLLFYRAMEEVMKCNIYIFSRNNIDPNTGEKMSIIQLPNHKYFHSHPPSADKPVVLILSHWGSRDDILKHPHCELIIEQRPDEDIYSYGNDMNNLLYPALMFAARTLTWQIYETVVDTPEMVQSVPEMVLRQDIYSSLNYQEIFGDIPIGGQIIDSAGKARLFMLAPELNKDNKSYSNLRIFVNVPPTAPLNIPSLNPEDIYPFLPDYRKTIELFGEPISATKSSDEQYLTGLWFPLADIQFGFYCPCKIFLWEDFLNLYPNINQNSELAALTIDIPQDVTSRLSPIQRIRRLRKIAGFLDQIIKYLYLIHKTIDIPEAQLSNHIDNFLNMTTTLYDGDKDSVDIYDSSKIKRILPTGTVEEVLSQLSIWSPEMFPEVSNVSGISNSKILIYDDQMRIGIKYQLSKFAKDIIGLNITPSKLRTLQNFYAYPEDFNFNPKTQFLLLSNQEFNDWTQIYILSSSLQQREIQNLKDNVHTVLNPNSFTYTEPYIYQKSGNTIVSSSYNPVNDNFYLIQNVAGSEFERAIQVALNWVREKINTGHGTQPYIIKSNILPTHVIYRISNAGTIFVEQNNSQGQDLYLEILHYGNELYAAMLPLL